MGKPWKVRRAALAAKGLCIRCTEPARPTRRLCQACADKDHARYFGTRQVRESTALCKGCGKMPPEPGRVCCTTCLELRRTHADTFNEKNRKKRTEYERQRRIRCRALVLGHYGDSCACCGEREPIFLTVDHIDGGGTAHRLGNGISDLNIWLVRMKFPPGFRILCYNCNCGRDRNGGICPHAVRTPDATAST